MRGGVVGFGDVVGLIGESLAGSVSEFLVARADLANRILRVIVPGNLRFAVYVKPPAMHFTQRAARTAILIERDGEVMSVAVAHFPFPHEAATRRPLRVA